MTVHQPPLPSGVAIPDREDRDWVTSQELVAEAGISYRQFDYWCRTGLLHGHPNTKVRPVDSRYPGEPITPETPGISLQVIRRHIDQLLAEHRLVLGPITITVQPDLDQAGATA